MTSSDKKKTALLAVLIVVAIVAWTRMDRTDSSPAKGGSPAATANNSKPVAPTQEAQIRWEWIEETSSGDIGRRNLFTYRPKPVPPPKVVAAPTPPPGPVFDVQPPRPTVPIGPPPPPPFKAFRYDGFSVNRGNGKLLGSISESGVTYKVSEGDYLMGKYHIARLTETLVEIEDVEQKRKQTFTRQQ